MAQSSSSKNNNHFLPADKLVKACKRKIDSDAIKGIQGLAEKMVQDIITRSALLAQHAEGDVIDAAEVCNIIESNFDASFGIKANLFENKQPLDSHTEKIAEITKQK